MGRGRGEGPAGAGQAWLERGPGARAGGLVSGRGEWRPGLRQDPEGEWAAAVPHLDCQRTFFLFAFFFFSGASGGDFQSRD